MLRRMRSYLLDDQVAQEQLEQQLLPLARLQVDRNLAAFRAIMPAVAEAIQACSAKRYRIFASRFIHFNLCDKASDTVLYGEDPEQEARAEVSSFLANAPCIVLNPQQASSTSSSKQIALEPLSEQHDVILMFGVGLGHQLLYLIEQCQPKYIILYEPNVELLFASVHCCDWSKIFSLCQQKKIQLFFQLGHNGQSVCDDLRELKQADPSIQKAYCYRHYFHSEMDRYFLGLLHYSAQFHGFPDQIPAVSESYTAVPFRARNVLANEPTFNSVKTSVQHSKLFERNISAFEQHFPDVYSAFKGYRWQHWRPVLDNAGAFMLEHMASKARITADDEESIANAFLKAPERFTTLISQKITGKYAGYLHYQYMKKLHVAAKDLGLDVKTPPVAAVPEHLRSLCVFGISTGGGVTALLQQRRVDHLLIFEPNPDFFYASMFQIPWHKELDGIQDQNGIYFNIGGDGAEYYQDLIQHIQVKGSYQLTDCFYLQGYADGQLSAAISKLSRELLLLFTNNEYFDAARSILAHLRENSAQGYPFLLDSKQRKAAPINYPVFIVGNGPSLDDSLDIIRQHQGRAIVISCSTALKTLHKAGIRPDYHMEVEIQLATHSWITQIKDADYLKQITLLSVGGVHPETAKLFRDTLLVLKKDDTCYSSFHQQVAKLGIWLAEAAKTYPTVSNFALSVCAELGVSEVYLFGVDLGYKDPNQHHSKHSAYYKDDGKALHDFSRVHGQSKPVDGNFQAEVLTSASFDYARGMMESSLDDSKGAMTVFNCSDGALIQGTVPLSADKLLLATPDATSKERCLDLITTRYFYPLTDAEYHKVFAVFDYAKLESQLKEIESIVNQPVESHQAAFALLSRQQDLLLRNYFSQNNLLAQLFLGEANYFSAALCKFLDFDATDKLVYFNAALAVYKEFLQQAIEALQSPLAFDQADTTLFSKKS